jgi:hypothetical protein
MPAAKAPAEHDHQSQKETYAKYSNASRSHEPIVAAATIFDN